MITAMKEVNICTYFLLPLLGLSEHSFGENNFKDSYVSEDGQYIYVGVHSVIVVPFGVRQDVPVVRTIDGEAYLKFKFPELWKNDVKLFLEGKYSKMSHYAKTAIRSHSGLMYKQEQGDTFFTDFRLVALDRSPDLIAEWNKHLYGEGSVSILDIDPTIELLEAPDYRIYFRKEVE